MYADKKRNFLFLVILCPKKPHYSTREKKVRVACVDTLKQKHNSIANHSLIPSH